jgi:hypothetical protein
MRLAICLLLLLLLLLATPAAAAVTCKSSPGHHRSHWAYRVVDGKRCWYAGPRGLSRSRLHWRARARPARVGRRPGEDREKTGRKSPPPMELLPAARENENAWPAVPELGHVPFADRWRGER